MLLGWREWEGGMAMTMHTTFTQSTCTIWIVWNIKNWRYHLPFCRSSALVCLFQFLLSYSSRRRRRLDDVLYMLEAMNLCMFPSVTLIILAMFAPESWLIRDSVFQNNLMLLRWMIGCLLFFWWMTVSEFRFDAASQFVSIAAWSTYHESLALCCICETINNLVEPLMFQFEYSLENKGEWKAGFSCC